MRKILFYLFIFTSFISNAQWLSTEQVKRIWEPRVMPSVVNLDSTWSAYWNKTTDGIPVTPEGLDTVYVKSAYKGTDKRIAYFSGDSLQITGDTNFYITNSSKPIMTVGTSQKIFTSGAGGGLDIATQASSGTGGFMLSLSRVVTDQKIAAVFGESTTNAAQIARYNTAYSGNYSGTSIAFANSFEIVGGQGASLGTLPVTIKGTPIYGLVGGTAANLGFRQDATGFRIGSIDGLHTSNTAAFSVNATDGSQQAVFQNTFTPSTYSVSSGQTGSFSWDENNVYVKTVAGWKSSPLNLVNTNNVLEYEYVAQLAVASATVAPTATIMKNTLPQGAITWTRSGTGVWNGALTNGFTANKTYLGGIPFSGLGGEVYNIFDGSAIIGYYYYQRVNATNIEVHFVDLTFSAVDYFDFLGTNPFPVKISVFQ